MCVLARVQDWLYDCTISPCSALTVSVNNRENQSKPICWESSPSVSVDHICSSLQNQKWVHPLVPRPRKRGKGPRRWRQEGKYLFCGLSVELQTSVCLLRKLSPAREQPKQTIPHHAVWLAVDPCVFVCSDSRHDRRRNTGKEEIWRTREREQELEKRRRRRRLGCFMR